jgi:hypothetical protein
MQKTQNEFVYIVYMIFFTKAIPNCGKKGLRRQSVEKYRPLEEDVRSRAESTAASKVFYQVFIPKVLVEYRKSM